MPRNLVSRRKQSGFTLVEIAIVLVIIGLLLGGVLKGQELINSAKVKNMVNDFRSTSTFVSGYQDRFRAFPGDQNQGQVDAAFGTTPVNGAQANICTPTAPGKCAINNGHLDGSWNDKTVASETYIFWQHVRLANLAAGPVDTTVGNFLPTNADGGQIGIESGISATGTATPFITGMRGSYYVCMEGVLGRYAKQIDTTMDDGNTAGGSVQAVAQGSTRGVNADTSIGGTPTATINDGSQYIVCAAF